METIFGPNVFGATVPALNEGRTFHNNPAEQLVEARGCFEGVASAAGCEGNAPAQPALQDHR
jgi:hypothetical protein